MRVSDEYLQRLRKRCSATTHHIQMWSDRLLEMINEIEDRRREEKEKD